MKCNIPESHKVRHGVVYPAVLGISLILSVICISSLHLVRLEHRESRTLEKMASARLAAQSGIDFVLSRINSDANWRTTYTSGEVLKEDSTWGNLSDTGTFEFMLIDDDGDLADNPHDSVTVRAIGRSGNAVFVQEVTLQSAGEGISCLSVPFHSQGTTHVKTVFTTDHTISSNNNVNANYSGGRVGGNAQAVGTIPGTVTGTKTEGMDPPLQMPNKQRVFDYYQGNGTVIGYGQIPGGTIERVVISPGNNPYGSGTTNVQGIYVIDCLGNDLVIRDSRINATLVLLNAGPGTRIQGYMHWEPAIARFPAMMVQGNLQMNWLGTDELRESLLGVNFNPEGSPYNGVTDSNTTTVYPGVIKGLVYVSGDLSFTSPAQMHGVTVVGGIATVDASSTVNYDPGYLQSAPPGFAGGSTMTLVPGSWRQMANQ